jgi:ribosome-associated toxin RatA of RatAB toxin-antitoxin module
MKRIARSAIVEHGAAQVCALVEDVEAYPSFLPWCRAAEVRERGAHTTVATLTVGVAGLKQAFTTRNRNRAPAAIDMQLVEGPFRRFAATWRFHELAADACRIEFSMEYEFASRALARMLEPLFDKIADTMVDAFARRATQVYGSREG